MRQIGAIALVYVRLQLQGFHRGHASEVFGEKGLVARAEQELLVQPLTKDGHHDETGPDDECEDAQRNERELPAIGKHHSQEDHQEGQIKHQAHGGAGDELAQGLHPVQPRHKGTSGALLEIRQRQTQEMPHHFLAQDGVDAATGVHQ